MLVLLRPADRFTHVAARIRQKDVQICRVNLAGFSHLLSYLIL